MTGPKTSAETEGCRIHKFIEGLSGSAGSPDETILYIAIRWLFHQPQK